MVDNPTRLFDAVALAAAGQANDDAASNTEVVANCLAVTASMKVTGSAEVSICFYSRLSATAAFDDTPFKSFTATAAMGQFTRDVLVGRGRHSIKCIATNLDAVNAGTVTVDVLTLR